VAIIVIIALIYRSIKSLTHTKIINVIHKYLPSLFILASKHLARRQARHWFLWVLSIGQRPFLAPWALQIYSRLLCMLRLKNPEQPDNVEKFIYDYAAILFINIRTIIWHSKNLLKLIFKKYKSQISERDKSIFFFKILSKIILKVD